MCLADDCVLGDSEDHTDLRGAVAGGPEPLQVRNLCLSPGHLRASRGPALGWALNHPCADKNPGSQLLLMLVNKGLTRYELLRVQGKSGGIGLALTGRHNRRSFWLILRFDGLDSLDLGFDRPEIRTSQDFL
jgi:hypothetical protein